MPQRRAGSARSRPAASRRRAPPAAASRRSWRRRAPPGAGPRASIFSMSVAVERRSPLRTMTSPWRIVTRTGCDRLGGLVARAVVVSVQAERRVRDDERRDELGGEHPLRLVEPAGHPAGQARLGSRRPRCRAARSARSRRGPGPPRSGRPPSARRRGRRASPSPGPRGRGRRSRAGLLPASGDEVGRERRVDPRRRGCSKRELLGGRDRDRVLGREVVLERDRGARGRPRRVGLDLALEVDRARARRCRAVASWPSAASSGCSGRMSAPRIAASARIRIPAAIDQARDVAAREAGRGVDRAGSAWSGHRMALSGSRRRGRRGRRSASAWTTSSLTCLPSARPRVRGASQPMTLPMSRAEDAPVAAIAFADERGDLVLGQGLRAGTRRGSRSRPLPWRRGPRGRRPGRPRPTRGGS